MDSRFSLKLLVHGTGLLSLKLPNWLYLDQISHSQPTLNKLMAIEDDIITSHINEHSHEETIAVAKIKEDPNFFFRYAKMFSITKQEIGPLYSDNGSLTNDKNLFVNYYLNSLIVHSQYHYPIKW